MSPMPLKKTIHGTRTAYTAGCRCFQCKAANSRYQVAWARKTRERRRQRIISGELRCPLCGHGGPK